MAEYKLISDNYIKSLLSSKALQKTVYPKKFNLFFLGKNRNKAQILFLFIILSLIMDRNLKLCIKIKPQHKPKFLGFRIYLTNFYMFKFIILQLSILDAIKISSKKSNKAEANIIFKEFPIVYEIDRLCEQQNSILNHIKNYTLVINTKLKLKSSFDWFYVECYIRVFKLPYHNIIRDKQRNNMQIL